MGGVLLHGAVSVFVTAASYNHVGLLAEEGLTCVSRLLLVLHLVDDEAQLVILSEVVTLDLRSLVQRVRFGSTDGVEVGRVVWACLLVTHTRIQRVRAVGGFEQIKSILSRLGLLAVASRLARTHANASGHLIPSATRRLAILRENDRVGFDRPSAAWSLQIGIVFEDRRKRTTLAATSNRLLGVISCASSRLVVNTDNNCRGCSTALLDLVQRRTLKASERLKWLVVALA